MVCVHGSYAWTLNTPSPLLMGSLYPSVLELSLRSVGFPCPLCTYANLEISLSGFLTASEPGVFQHPHPGPSCSNLLTGSPQSLSHPHPRLSFPCLSLQGHLVTSMKLLAAQHPSH
jgi:hypothetical protein